MKHKICFLNVVTGVEIIISEHDDLIKARHALMAYQVNADGNAMYWIEEPILMKDESMSTSGNAWKLEYSPVKLDSLTEGN